MKLDKNRRQIIKILTGASVYAAGIIYNSGDFYISMLIFVVAFVIIGGDILFNAVRNIFNGQIFDENLLMSLATIGAFAIGDYPEGVAVMLFYQIGELFQSFAVDRSRKSIADLMDIRPDYANVQRGDVLEKVYPDEVKINDVIVIKAGEKIPLDSEVISGTSTIDTSALTGESIPREISQGDTLLSGCVNINGMLTARVTKEFGESTVSKILDLVENASDKKSDSEKFITKFARYYTPAVVSAAALLAVIPPLIINGAVFSDWIYRALVFLVISCPCALVISIPLSFFGGIGGASKSGILIKGSNYLEALSKTEIVVFDKTGTLTKGVFAVQDIVPVGTSKEDLLELAAYAEAYSNHPISVSLKKAYNKDIDHSRISDIEEIPGEGVLASINGKKIAAGNSKLMKRIHAKSSDTSAVLGTVIHVAVEDSYKGYIIIADEIKEDSLQTIRDLKAAGMKQIVMLTGDAKAIGEKAASLLGIDKVYTELLPADKVHKVEELLKQKSPKGKLVFVGDGINDAPVLALSDIGIAMGGLGSDAAIEAADVVIMTDEPHKLSVAISIAQKTLRIAKQNIVLALTVKSTVLALGAVGLASMWAAVFADVGVTILAILNAIRMLGIKQLQ